MRAVIAAAGVTLAAGQAQAHAFTSGADQYAQFVEGAGVMLGTPAIVLALVPMGLLVGQNGQAAMPRVWPALLAGLAGGWIAAPSVGPGITLAAVGAGAVTGALGALIPRLAPAALMALTALSAALSVMVALEGHGRWELPWLIIAGIMVGAHLVLVLPAAGVAATTDRWPAPWLRIGWRVVSSWAGAIALIFGAFLMRG
jgi:hypothetical protein